MNRNRKNRSLLKERVTILLVVFFCILISGSERFVQFDSSVKKVEQAASEEQPNENQTFLDVAVDAVVPFATTVAETALYFIYEIVGFEKETFAVKEEVSRYPSHFLEILLTRIISPNAP
ncbi:hypothetical protein [Litoribacter populi]|uniref:hypothetical protein n=1 Tax=Litoribacter populi TaxID=2598460 RepID=UPI0011815206|nr:hypothetical protein [Litoribacter populi]